MIDQLDFPAGYYINLIKLHNVLEDVHQIWLLVEAH